MLDVQRSLADYLATRPEIRFALLYGSAAEDVRFRDLDIGMCYNRVHGGA